MRQTYKYHKQKNKNQLKANLVVKVKILEVSQGAILKER